MVELMSKVEGWSNLPYDVLLHITDGLGLNELHSLRGVCKDWHDLVSKALVEKIESFGCDPWFLVYDYDREAGSKCFLLRYKYYLLESLISMSDNVTICITIPELDGATCFESCGGWLLVFRGGSMFFFCPFSRAKIDLPSCPAFTELELSSGYVAAAFSAPPTSQNCIVVVITHCSNDELKLQLLSRGHDTWAKYKFSCGAQTLSHTIMTAVFRYGVFQFADNLGGLVEFDPTAKSIKFLRSSECYNSFYWNRFINRLRLHENIDSISYCGTVFQLNICDCTFEVVVRGQRIVDGSQSHRCLKGVFIEPRFHTPIMDQTW